MSSPASRGDGHGDVPEPPESPHAGPPGASGPPGGVPGPGPQPTRHVRSALPLTMRSTRGVPGTEPPPDGGDRRDSDEPRRLSLVRLGAILAILAGLGLMGSNWARSALRPKPIPPAGTWFAPYVDTTLTPTYPFESASDQPARQVVLGFVVADPSGACAPSWGAAYSLARADQTLSMSARIEQLGINGQRAIVSFGGASHTPLAVACPTANALTGAYASVIARYSLSAIDLDVEGAALDDPAATQRTAHAVRALEQRDRSLQVWLTLPVEPSGLQDNAVEVIGAMLAARVSLAGVNVMTMDFSSPPPAGTGMIGPVEQALRASHDQLITVFREHGVTLSPLQMWQHMGATVMNGENDIGGERFTVADARGLAAFAGRAGLARVSMWSINRDSQCGSVFSVTGVLSNTCSGTPQSDLEFSRIFAEMAGVVPRAVAMSAAALLPPQPDTNPADAPYPIWSPAAPYPQGYKVVESGNIYQALYYTSGADPSAQAQTGARGPWQLVGPVLPGDHAPALPRLPAGTYPAWSVSAVYQAGDRILFDGLPYAAKWNNQGASPAGEASDSYGSPWRPLFAIPGEPGQPGLTPGLFPRVGRTSRPAAKPPARAGRGQKGSSTRTAPARPRGHQ